MNVYIYSTKTGTAVSLFTEDMRTDETKHVNTYHFDDESELSEYINNLELSDEVESIIYK